MSWNYRLMKRRIGDEDVFEVHEVYYDADGKIYGYTAEATCPTGETWEEFQKAFTYYQRAAQCRKSAVLDYDALEAESAERRRGLHEADGTRRA